MIRNCKEYVLNKKCELKEMISQLKNVPKLVVIQIGNDPASNSYIKGKKKDCEEVGIEFELINLEDDPTYLNTKIVSELLSALNSVPMVHGIIIQLPVPKYIDIKELQCIISPEKDVDGFNKFSKFKPCTPEGIINFLFDIGYDFTGKDILVVGRSSTVGRPLAEMLIDLDATVTLAHSKTEGIKNHFLQKDLIFTCINQIEYFDFSYFQGKTDVIDIGLGLNIDGKLKGNLTSGALLKLEMYDSDILLSGVGCVGLLTRLELLKHVYKAALDGR